MGIDFDRIVSHNVDEGLVCTICADILDRPLMITKCEHTYCSDCINDWIQRNKTCPQDRIHIGPKQLVPIPRFMKNQLFNLKASCRFKSLGCDAVTTIEYIGDHETHCIYNEINTRVSQRVDNTSKEICVEQRVKVKHRYDYQVIRSSLSDNQKKLAIKLAKEALYLFGRVHYSDIAAYITEHLEPEDKRHWHCIAGTDYDCLLTANHGFITMRIDGIYIIAFKTK